MDAEWIIAVGIFLAGQLSLFALEWFRYWTARKQRRQDARDNFQKQTMMELQDVLYQLARALSHMRHEYKQVSAGEPLPNWPILEDPRVLGAGVFARINALSVRVDDRVVRELVQRFLDKHGEMFLETKDAGLEAFESQLNDLVNLQKTTNERIGELLRKL